MDAKNLTAADKNQTAEDYLKTERAGATKREFFDGKILANSSSNRANNLIATNTTIAIGSRLQGQKCEIYINDMRVRLSPKHFAYPDIVIVNGGPSFVDNRFDTLVNPTVAFEIFSKSYELPGQNRKARMLSRARKHPRILFDKRRRNAR